MALSPFAVPAGACDAHIHIFDPRFTQTLAADDMAGSAASVADYRAVQQRLGTQRTVIVTPRNYDTDNTVTLDAIGQLGLAQARGVAVLRPDVTDAQLAALHAGGIRGIRFTLYTPEHAPTGFEMVEPLAHRVHELGWHLQLHWTAAQIVAQQALLRRLPAVLVFDHLARVPVPGGLAHPACAVVAGLLERGQAWLKLSAPYLDSQLGAAGRYADVDAVARHWVQLAPERLVWGSDWPHTSEANNADTVDLLAKLGEWVDDGALWARILVDNPARLYGFGS
jgi:D-galactarolactone isomerase